MIKNAQQTNKFILFRLSRTISHSFAKRLTLTSTIAGGRNIAFCNFVISRNEEKQVNVAVEKTRFLMNRPCHYSRSPLVSIKVHDFSGATGHQSASRRLRFVCEVGSPKNHKPCSNFRYISPQKITIIEARDCLPLQTDMVSSEFKKIKMLIVRVAWISGARNSCEIKYWQSNEVGVRFNEFKGNPCSLYRNVTTKPFIHPFTPTT